MVAVVVVDTAVLMVLTEVTIVAEGALICNPRKQSASIMSTSLLELLSINLQNLFTVMNLQSECITHQDIL